MTLFDDTTAHNSESTSAVATEAEPTASEPTLTHQPEPNQAPATASTQEAPHAAAASDEKPASEDFASALESFTTETEEAVGEDRVIKGTVLKLTSTTWWSTWERSRKACCRSRRFWITRASPR
jgi:hypothetical protein